MSNQQILVVTAIDRTKNATQERYVEHTQRLRAILRDRIKFIEEKEIVIEGGKAVPGYIIATDEGNVVACVGDFRDAISAFAIS